MRSLACCLQNIQKYQKLALQGEENTVGILDSGPHFANKTPLRQSAIGAERLNAQRIVALG